MQSETNKFFHDTKNSVVSLKMGLDILREKYATNEEIADLPKKINDALNKLQDDWTKLHQLLIKSK